MYRWARELQPLVGRRLTRVGLPKRLREREPELLGRRVTRVQSRGKHLLLFIEGGYVLHCHAMMWGDWEVGRPGDFDGTPRVRLRLGTSTFEAVFTSGPVVELLRRPELRGHPRLSSLGPDILARRFDAREAGRRLRRHPDLPIGEALLRQDLVAGIGNVFKSEGLFQARIHPLREVRSLSAADLRRLWTGIIRMMRASARVNESITTLPPAMRVGGETRWVYRRTKRPCFGCGTPVRSVRQGGRDNYFCPRCQT